MDERKTPSLEYDTLAQPVIVHADHTSIVQPQPHHGERLATSAPAQHLEVPNTAQNGLSTTNTSDNLIPSTRATIPTPSVTGCVVSQRFPHTQVSFLPAGTTDGSAIDPLATPPDLNYTLRTRKKSLAIFWALVLIDCIAVPIALYFGLWYGTNLSHNAVFSISTGAIGTVSVVEYFIRFRRLWRKGSHCRVIGARRCYVGDIRSGSCLRSADQCGSWTGFIGICLWDGLP
jgi:hypothetical protein